MTTSPSASSHASQTPDLSPIHTLHDLFAMRCGSTPEREAYRWFDATSNQWQSFSWGSMHQHVVQWSQAIASLQLERGARIATLLTHSVHAICVDQAGMALGCATVPLHANDNP